MNLSRSHTVSVFPMIVRTAMKASSLILFVLLFLSCAPALAAAPADQRYDIAYGWDTDIQRVLDYRRKVAGLLQMAIDRQLLIVGRDQQFGVIHPLRGTLDQAKKTAEQQSRKLRRAGLKPAQVTKAKGHHALYHIGYLKGPSVERLTKDYRSIKQALGVQAGKRLAIERVDSRTFSIIYRCWSSKTMAARTAKQHGALLRGRKIAPAVIAAVERPMAGPNTNLATVADLGSERRQGKTVQAAIVQPGREQRTSKGKKTTAGERCQDKETVIATPADPPSETAGGGLSIKMNDFLRKQQAKGRLRQRERAALVAYDLTRNTYLTSVNSQRAFQAASMIKPFVALAFFHQVDKGKLSYTAQHRHMMEAMIQQSSNSATNWFIRQLGGPAKCEALLKKEYGAMLRQVRIREYIPPGGKTYKNSAPPLAYIQFLKALWNYQLPYSKEMLRVMSLPGRDRIFCGTEVPSGTQVFNKTGTTALLCGDMGILVPKTRDGRRVPYAIVGIVERASKPADYKQWMVSGGGVIRDFSSLVYEEMKRKYNLH